MAWSSWWPAPKQQPSKSGFIRTKDTPVIQDIPRDLGALCQEQGQRPNISRNWSQRQSISIFLIILQPDCLQDVWPSFCNKLIAGKRVVGSRWRQMMCEPFILFHMLMWSCKWPCGTIREMGLWMSIRWYWGIIVYFVSAITVYGYVRKSLVFLL